MVTVTGVAMGLVVGGVMMLGRTINRDSTCTLAFVFMTVTNNNEGRRVMSGHVCLPFYSCLRSAESQKC